MDRLPFELLNLIVLFIEAESSLPTRRTALASLSRINKTFHNIATSKLYRHVVLTSEQRVGQWGRFYTSRLNPWNLKDAKDELRDLVVPASITFTPSQDQAIELSTKQIFPLQQGPVDPLLAVSTPLTSFFFRNLTSFVVSAGFTLDPRFLAILLGPIRSLRRTLINLDLGGAGLKVAANFVLGAFIRFAFVMDWTQFDWKAWNLRAEEGSSYWERCCRIDDGDGAIEQEPEWLWDDDSRLSEERRLISTAPIDFESFRKLDSYIAGIHDTEHLQNGASQIYAFTKLERLTLVDPDMKILGIIYLQGFVYPALTCMRLTGEFEAKEKGPQWVLIWRLAITRRSGTIARPDDEASSSKLFVEGDLDRRLGPMTSEEMALAPENVYIGPDFCLIDLSALRIV